MSKCEQVVQAADLCVSEGKSIEYNRLIRWLKTFRVVLTGAAVGRSPADAIAYAETVATAIHGDV